MRGSIVSGKGPGPGSVVPGNALPRRMVVMIMRSVNDDGFDFDPRASIPPEWSVSGGDDGVCSDWRFVPLDPGEHRRIDTAHSSIAAPHMLRTARPAAPEAEPEFNQTLYFG